MKLQTIYIFESFSEGSPQAWVWEPGEVPESVGPDDLAEVLVHYRRFVREKREQHSKTVDTLAQLSDAGLKQLILHAYRASFLKDEGRLASARLVVPREQYRPPKSEAESHLIAQIVKACLGSLAY